jgi:hypothetical protein
MYLCQHVDILVLLFHYKTGRKLAGVAVAVAVSK